MEYLSQTTRGPDQLLALSYAAYGLVAGLILVVAIIIITRQRIKHAKQMAAGSIGNLETEKAKSSIILNAIEDGVVAVDTQNVIRIFNPAAGKLTGWEADDAVGLDFHAVFRFTDAQGNTIEATQDPLSKSLSESTNQRDSNIILVRKDNQQFFVSMGVSPIKSNDGHVGGVVAVFRDVSKEKEEERRRADFISTASHEMRTPVAAIEGYLALAMNNKVSSVDAKARNYLEKAYMSTQHLGKLFQDLLTSAKAEDGRLSSHPVVVELGEFLEQLVDSLRFSAEKKGLIVDFVVGAGNDGPASVTQKVIKPLYYVHVDPDRMREVITNLFDNAVKYTPDGKISIGLTGNKEVVQLFIRDTGPGIPADDIPHLFQKFYRVDNSATRTIGGTGLGLFICRKIVELYHGRIWVESQLRQGSTFYINLPRLDTQKAESLQKAEASQSASTSPLDKA